jgi:lipoprotein-anchoring transpeptidase ErfK/SrfK
MQQGGNAKRPLSALRARPVGFVLAGISLLALAACTSGTPTAGNPVFPVGGSTSSIGGPSSDGSTPEPTTSDPSEPAVITAFRGRHVSPVKPIEVSIANGQLTNVTMVNPEGERVRGAISDDGTSWQNTEVLGYSRTYRIVAHGVGDDGTAVTKRSKVTTLTPYNMTMPYIDDIYGSYIQDDGIYGVGMIVRVNFDEPVNQAKAEKTLQVETSNDTEGGWYWDGNQNAYWRPKEYWEPGTEVTVRAQVYGKDVGEGLYGQADRSVSFTIGQKRVAIADNKTHHVKVYFHDELVRNMKTSMGMGGSTEGKDGQTIYFWTMPGTYTVINHENPAIMSSSSYGLDSGPYAYPEEKVYFSTKISTDGIYLHSAPWSVWAQGHQNVSHGCLNLSPADAEWYYNHSHIGDIVQVIHSAGPKLQFWQGGQWTLSGSSGKPAAR